MKIKTDKTSQHFENDKNRPIDLSIIIPCYNETENVVSILNDVSKVIAHQGFTSEIVLVDDLSEDDTYNSALEWKQKIDISMPITVIRRELDRRGYGAVVRYGSAYAAGKYCIFVAADRVDPIRLIPRMYEEMENGASLVQISRYLKKGNDKTIPFIYKFYQFFYRFFVKLIFNESIADSTYAFKMFKRKEMLGVGLKQNRFSISPEITFKNILMQGKIVYIPGAQGVRKNGVSKFNFFREGPGYIYCLIRAFLHQRKILYWF